jgi:hypothetical protein
MSFEELLKAVIVLAVVIIPALALTLGLAAHFAARPIVEAIIKLRELSAPGPAPQIETRLGAVESEMRELRALVERVVAAVEFDAQIRAGGGVDMPRLPQA